MRKIHLFLLFCIIAIISCKKDPLSIKVDNLKSQDVIAQISTVVTTPVTAVSFPKEVITVNRGRIEFYARLIQFKGNISVGGYDPHFFQIYDGTKSLQMGFNANDGTGNGGLVGMACTSSCGTGNFGSWSYENIYADELRKWHHYIFKWNKKGLKNFSDGRQVAIYIDGVLNTTRATPRPRENFLPFTAGVLNLITTGGPSTGLPQGLIAMDEFQVYDSTGLILYNTLGSQQEIENSVVGLNGSFNGGGGAHFVKGVKGGMAVEAEIVGGIN